MTIHYDNYTNNEITITINIINNHDNSRDAMLRGPAAGAGGAGGDDMHSCHILPFQPILWNSYFPPEPVKPAKNSPSSISEGGRLWQVWHDSAQAAQGAMTCLSLHYVISTCILSTYIYIYIYSNDCIILIIYKCILYTIMTIYEQ